MTRVELALILGALILASAAAGWGLRALWGRIGRREGGEAETAELSRRLADAEDALDALRARAEADAAAAAAELAETKARLGADLAQRQAELDATMDTVGELRRRLAEAGAPSSRRAGGA